MIVLWDGDYYRVVDAEGRRVGDKSFNRRPQAEQERRRLQRQARLQARIFTTATEEE